MATINCDLCGDEPAVLLQTRLDGGDSMSVGQACLVTFSLTCAIAFSEGAEPEEQATYSDLVAALLANLAPSMLQLAKSSVPRPPRRKATQSPQQPTQAEIDDAVARALDSAADEASERDAAVP